MQQVTKGDNYAKKAWMVPWGNNAVRTAQAVFSAAPRCRSVGYWQWGVFKMVVEYVRYRIVPENHEAFLAAYTLAATSLDASEFCLGYELTQCVEEPERFVLRIEWTSTEDHMGKFRNSKEFSDFLPHIRPYIANIEEMQHYGKTHVVSKVNSVEKREM